MRLLRSAVAAIAMGMLVAAASAHHSFVVEFDAADCRDFSGILTKLEWTNPHAYFYVDVKNAAGNVESWSFQTYALVTLRRAGNDRQVFLDNIGKEVWVRGCLARNGRPHYAAAGTLRFASDGLLRQAGQVQN